MPIPFPTTDETEKSFMERVMHFLTEENKKRSSDKKWSHEQMIAIAMSRWREYKKDFLPPKADGIKTAPQEIVAKLNVVKNLLLEKFGKAGEIVWEFTMNRLGVFDTESGQYFLKADAMLPFAKSMPDGSIEFGNLVLGESTFTKIDPSTHTVEGYAITCAVDVADDMMFPEAYEKSLDHADKRPFFMHDVKVPAGRNLYSQLDNIGWYVKDEVDDKFWKLIEEGVIKGYSTSGGRTWTPKRVGNVNVYDQPNSVVVVEHSLVTNPCNKLSFFKNSEVFAKSESQQMTVSTNVKGGAANLDTDGNKPRGKSKMSDPAIPADTNIEPNQPTTPRKLEELSQEQLLRIINDNAERKLKNQLINTIKDQEKAEAEEQEEQRYKIVQTELAKQKATNDDLAQKNEELGAKVALLNEKFAKFEDKSNTKSTPEPTQQNLTMIDQLTANAAKLDARSAWTETEKMVSKK